MKRWQHLFEIYEPSLQEKQAIEALHRIPGKPENWKVALHYVMRRIPRQTRNRHYIVLHLKRPIETIRYDGPGALNTMRVQRALVYGVSPAKDREMLDILNWPSGWKTPRGMGALEFSDLRKLVSTVEVVELPKSKIDSVLGLGKNPYTAKDTPTTSEELRKERIKSGEAKKFDTLLARSGVSGVFLGRWVVIDIDNAESRIVWDIKTVGHSTFKIEPCWIVGVGKTNFVKDADRYLVYAKDADAAQYKEFESEFSSLYYDFYNSNDYDDLPHIRYVARCVEWEMARKEVGGYQLLGGKWLPGNLVKE